MASGELVLAKSLGMDSFARNSADTVQEADALYRPYVVQDKSGATPVQLGNLVGVPVFVAIVGLESVGIGDTVSDFEVRRALERLHVDEPTLQMTFGINNSPLAGREGRYVPLKETVRALLARSRMILIRSDRMHRRASNELQDLEEVMQWLESDPT